MKLSSKNENRETRNWGIVLLVSTIFIVLVAGYFVVQLIVRNPLKGNWVSKERGYLIEIENDNEVDIEGNIRNIPVEVKLRYTIDKEAKTITFLPNTESYIDAVEESEYQLTIGDITAYLTNILTAFDYNLENGKLILTEREYGEQLIFTRVK